MKTQRIALTLSTLLALSGCAVEPSDDLGSAESAQRGEDLPVFLDAKPVYYYFTNQVPATMGVDIQLTHAQRATASIISGALPGMRAAVYPGGAITGGGQPIAELAIGWEPTGDQLGVHDITLKVANARGATTQDLELVVLDAPTKPTGLEVVANPARTSVTARWNASTGGSDSIRYKVCAGHFTGGLGFGHSSVTVCSEVTSTSAVIPYDEFTSVQAVSFDSTISKDIETLPLSVAAASYQ